MLSSVIFSPHFLLFLLIHPTPTYILPILISYIPFTSFRCHLPYPLLTLHYLILSSPHSSFFPLFILISFHSTPFSSPPLLPSHLTSLHHSTPLLPSHLFTSPLLYSPLLTSPSQFFSIRFWQGDILHLRSCGTARALREAKLCPHARHK